MEGTCEWQRTSCVGGKFQELGKTFGNEWKSQFKESQRVFRVEEFVSKTKAAINGPIKLKRPIQSFNFRIINGTQSTLQINTLYASLLLLCCRTASWQIIIRIFSSSPHQEHPFAWLRQLADIGTRQCNLNSHLNTQIPERGWRKWGKGKSVVG